MQWLRWVCLATVAAGSAGCNCGSPSQPDSGAQLDETDGGDADGGDADAGRFDAGHSEADAGNRVDGGAQDAGVLLVVPSARVLKASGTGSVLVATLAGASGDISWGLSPAVGSLSATSGTQVTYSPPARQDWGVRVRVTATAAGLTVDTLLTVVPAGLWADWPVPPDSSSSYSSAAGTATDPVTALVWQLVPTDALSWPDADAHCHGLSLGGSTRWRLPAPIELVSLVDFGRRGPALAPTFSSGFMAQVWSSLVWDDDSASAFFVDFNDGSLASVELSNGEVPVRGVRCVRDAADLVDTSSGEPYPWPRARGVGAWDFRYALDPEVVGDVATGLRWQRQPSGPSTLAEATATCQGLSLGGFPSGWRVPTIKELLTLADLWGGGVDGLAFPSAPAGAYWSSSFVAAGGGAVWSVDFVPPTSGVYNRATPVSEAHLVRCVR
jgi:hypothetical protein